MSFFQDFRGRALRGGLCLALVPTFSLAAPVVVTNNDNIGILTGALVVPGTGINIMSSELVLGTATQQGTYTNFNLAPSSGSTPTLTLGDGVVLSSTSDIAAV